MSDRAAAPAVVNLSADRREAVPPPGDVARLRRNQGASDRHAGARWFGRVKRVDDLGTAEIALWQDLVAAQSHLRSPFFSFEFVRAVEEAGADARVCLLYHDNELAGFFPFQFSGAFARAWGAAERIGGELNDFCGLVIDPSRYGSIDPEQLLRCAGLASLDVSHLEEHQARLGLCCSVTSEGARIAIAGDLDGYWRNVKATHASDYDTLARRQRQVARKIGAVDFTFAHADPGALVHQIVEEKRSQYDRTASDDGFAEPWKLACLERIASYRAGRCVPVVSTLYFDGTWAALHFGLRAGNVLHYWFPVYNSKFGGLSPGLILLARMISDAKGHDIDELDLGEGLSRYKNVFATEIYPIHRDFWNRRTPRGLFNRGMISMRWRMEAARQKKATDADRPAPASGEQRS